MNIPTAEELGNKHDMTDGQKSAMIEFAKLHVQAAIKAASENADMKIEKYTDDWYIDRSSILSAYPLTNIK